MRDLTRKWYTANSYMRRLFGLFFIAGVFVLCYGSTAYVSADTEADLTAQLEDIEKQILKQQVLVDDKGLERQSLERDVAILDAKIKKAQLGILARNIEIQKLGGQIGTKQITVNILTDKTGKQRQSLAQLIRKTNEIDNYSLVEVLLGGKTLSTFFEDLESFQSIKTSLQSSLKNLSDTKSQTLEQKTSLEGKQQSEIELRKLQELEKKEVEDNQTKKAKILSVTKGQEAVYQKLLHTQQKTAAEIRMQLFRLRDSGSIPFPEALKYAEFAGGKTGVRPALIMGILTQETNLGENIGIPGRWTTAMHPTRDQPIFKVIMAKLGLDPDAMPVSGKPSYGWGGAMGPAQFIPSTWIQYGGFVSDGAGSWVYDQSQDRIRQLTGKSSPSNPYDKQDAFMASALLMADNGAAGGAFANERMAALRYFAGWGNASNPSYAFYGDGVMAHATSIQSEIDILKGN